MASGRSTALRRRYWIATPGGLDEYFADLHAAINANADPAEVRAIQATYGIIPS